MRAACVGRPAESPFPALPCALLPYGRASARTLRTVSVSAPSSPSVRMSSAADDASGPTAAELLDFVRRVASDAEIVASLPLDPEGRTWVQLEGPGGSEAWLIGWPPGTGTGWHDHADSVGAFTTAAGDAQGAVARRPAAHRRLEDPRTHRGHRPFPRVGHRPGQGVRPPSRPRGAERVGHRACRLRPRVLPAAAPDPALQPQRRAAPP